MVNPDTALRSRVLSQHIFSNVAEMRLNRKLTGKINPYTALLCDVSRDEIELEVNGKDTYTALFCDVSRSDMRLKTFLNKVLPPPARRFKKKKFCIPTAE